MDDDKLHLYNNQGNIPERVRKVASMAMDVTRMCGVTCGLVQIAFQFFAQIFQRFCFHPAKVRVLLGVYVRAETRSDSF